MIFEGVRLPDEIRIALEEGRLVIFAGAGVSRGHPSNLPDFPGLVEKAGNQLGQLRDPDLREDEVLGRWAEKNLAVHEVVARIVSDPTSLPTVVHKGILGIFGEAAKVRIVTTNFDKHFSAAAAEVFSEQPLTTFVAPAIPLGDDFEGLVYIHGAAKDAARKLVLTDDDFGQAYLTRGWAKDFLLSLFSKFAVLFVGYSHNDVVVSYLARGMRRSQQRWTLVPACLKPADRERWKHLGIGTVEYPVGETEQTMHEALGKFFGAWSAHCATSLLDHSARIKSIARALPPETDDTAEYIDYCLGHHQLVRDFFDTLSHPAWIGWLVGRHYAQPLFASQLDRFEPRERCLAQWLCTYVREKHSEQLLDLIRRHNNRMSPAFADVLAHQLWTTSKKQTVPRFALWVSLLLAQGTDIISRTIWGYIFKQCQLPDHAGIALRLFQMLTAPRLKVKEYWDIPLEEDEKQDSPKGSSRKVDYEIEWTGEREVSWLKDAWEDGLKELITSEGERIVGVVTQQMTEANALLREVGKASATYDSLSWGRSSISDHEQDDSPIRECASLLITIARDVLEYWLIHNRARAIAQMDIWWSYNQPLLRRLVVHGVTLDSGRTAGGKLKWLLDTDQLFLIGMKKEVFDLLKTAYPQASIRIKRRVIARIKRGIIGDRAEKLDARTIAYEKFNVLQWLKRHTRDCPEVEKALAPIIRDYPQFGVSEHQEFDHWHGKAGFMDPKEGFDFDQILAEPEDHYVEALLGAVETSFLRDRWSYISNLSALFGKDREWGARFMTALARRDYADKDLWTSVFGEWRELLKTKDDWLWMLNVCEALPRKPTILGGIAYALSHGFWNDEVGADDAMIARADALVQSAWETCRDDPEPMDASNKDWLTDAINHRGGWIAEFWFPHLNFLRRKSGKRWRAIPRRYRANLKEALNGGNAIRNYARITLIPWIAYLFVWDKKLVRDHFLPLFDWKRDPVVAQQSWSVFLNYRRATNEEWELGLLEYLKEFVAQLKPMLRDVTAQDSQFDHHTLHSLGLHLAGLAMRVITDPVKSGFFTDFLPLAPDTVRSSIAHGIGQHMEDMNQDERDEVWHRWLKQYLTDRISGIPTALSFEESNAIARWVPELGTLFPEAVAIVEKMSLQKAPGYSVTEDLVEKKLAEHYPSEACRLCNHVLAADEFPSTGNLDTLHAIFEERIPRTREFERFLEIRYQQGWRPPNQ